MAIKAEMLEDKEKSSVLDEDAVTSPDIEADDKTDEITDQKREKEERIRKEIRRLRRVFRDLDKNKSVVVKDLIHRAAFMSVSLEDLEDEINRYGYTEEYCNGENQFGTKQSEAVKIHLAMMKNLTAVVKQLTDLVPPAKRKESKLEALRRE